jgi:hypothetical protein
MDEQEYKVVRQLDEVMPRALRSQKAGVSFDVRVYFRENDDGYRWAEVAFLDRDADHAIIDHMPLVGDGVVSWFFGQIEERGFRLAGEGERSDWLALPASGWSRSSAAAPTAVSMSDSQDEQWSPARSPYAIAVSQSWWALRAVRLFAADAKKADGPEQQIYARQVFGQLRALRRCAEMQAKELRRLGVAEGDRVLLDQGIEEFDVAVPAAKPARDILEHFDDYARGEGRLQREAMRDLGLGVHEAAAMFWGGGYNPATEQITEGPFAITIPEALVAADRLNQAIYGAGRAIDKAAPPPG